MRHFLYAQWLVIHTSLPHVHVQQGVKHNCSCRSVGQKLPNLEDLGIWATCKHNESVEIVKKFAPLCFKWFGKVHEHHKTAFLLATPIDRTLCAFCSFTQPSIVCRKRSSISATAMQIDALQVQCVGHVFQFQPSVGFKRKSSYSGKNTSTQ